MTVMPLEEYDRLPSTRAEAPVDAIGFRLHFRHQILVALDMGPAGRPDLHERKLLLIRRVLIEKTLDSAEPLRNAFGIIDPIDAKPHESRLDSQLTEQFGSFRARSLRWGRSAVLLEGHADREGPDRGEVILAADGEMFPIDPRFQRVIHGLQKIVAVRLDMESDQIRSEHSV